MIDPKDFLSLDVSEMYEDMNQTFMCQNNDCFEKGHCYFDEKNKVIIWTCPNGHENRATIRYE